VEFSAENALALSYFWLYLLYNQLKQLTMSMESEIKESNRQLKLIQKNTRDTFTKGGADIARVGYLGCNIMMMDFNSINFPKAIEIANSLPTAIGRVTIYEATKRIAIIF